MHKASTSAKCCPQFDRLPRDVRCFIPDVLKEWQRLVHRHNVMFTKRKRLLQLAVPHMYCTPRYIPKCPCKFKKPIEIVRDIGEIRDRTRTTQLAFPLVRKLLIFKERVRKLYSPQRMEIINRLIRNSLLSLYSRLENIQPPQKKEPIKKWDAAEWKTHTKYLKKLAKPKVPPPVPKIKVNRKPLSELKRFKKLARPKRRLELAKEDWVLTPGIKYYQPTERILYLAKPLERDDSALHQNLPLEISPTALKVKASARTKELAAHREKGVTEMDLKENPFAISPNALKAKASARIQELAEPKEYENAHIRENPFLISPAALKAKASPRIIELAKPKGS